MACSDKKIRDGAVANLVAFLSRGTHVEASDDHAGEPNGESSYVPLSEEEMDKLWKGLFYCQLARSLHLAQLTSL